MSDEEQLKDYLKKNALKAEKKALRKATANQPTIKPRSNFRVYFRGIGSIIMFIVVVMLSFLVLLISGFAFENLLHWTQYESLVAGTFMAGALILIYLISWIARLITFLNWANGKSYKLLGWEEFVARRSDDFWKGQYYTPIQIVITLTNDASPIHKEATSLFIAKWQEKRKGYYARMPWQSGSGTPDEFTSKGLSIKGDIGRGELDHVIEMLSRKFIPLVKLLGRHLEAVEIESQTKESQHQKEKTSRNAYDRSW